VCSILGINRQLSQDNLDNILKDLFSRGKDDAQTKIYPNSSFGHTRLNIVSTQTNGIQPMVVDNLLIVFNGEIYNYKELIKQHNLKITTNTDTEVHIKLYQKYKEDFLNLLNGSFSFCIYDISCDSYFCVRDRYGKKPFYYFASDSRFAFCSMIKPLIKLLGLKISINKVALSQYLQYFVPLEPNTFYKDIFKLPKGSYLTYCNNTLKIKKYYKIKPKQIITNETKAIKKIEQILLESINKRIDTRLNIGAFLSGGIDSSLISSIVSKVFHKQLDTFSIGYETYTKYDELQYANLVAKDIKSNHHVINLTKKDFIDSLDVVFDILEEPHADPATIALYHLSKQINQNNIKIALSGEGSDELFLGYDNYQKFYQYYCFKDTLTKEQKKFLKNISASFADNKEAIYLKRVLNDETIYNSFGELFTPSQRKKLLKKVANFKQEKPKNDPIAWMSYIDMKIWLGDALLSKVDKITMANNIETRNPFLDFHLVDFVFSIKSDLKLSNTNKYLLKQVAKKYLPNTIINRPKKGFNTPYNEWLFEYFGTKLYDDIIQTNQQTQLFNQEYIDFLYHNAKQNKLKQQFYALWHFCRWYNQTFL